MIASIKSRSTFVAPPLEGKRANRHDVTVAHARARQESINAEFFEAVDNFRKCLVVGEVLKAHRSPRGASFNEPAVVATALHGDLFRNWAMHHDLVLKRFGFIVSSLRHESCE